MLVQYISTNLLSLLHQPINYMDGLVQERRNSSALAMELRLSCINPSIWWLNSLGFGPYHKTMISPKIKHCRCNSFAIKNFCYEPISAISLIHTEISHHKLNWINIVPKKYKYFPKTCGNTQTQNASHIDGSVQDCSISTANALEILQSCTKPSIYAPCYSLCDRYNPPRPQWVNYNGGCTFQMHKYIFIYYLWWVWPLPPTDTPSGDPFQHYPRFPPQPARYRLRSMNGVVLTLKVLHCSITHSTWLTVVTLVVHLRGPFY